MMKYCDFGHENMWDFFLFIIISANGKKSFMNEILVTFSDDITIRTKYNIKQNISISKVIEFKHKITNSKDIWAFGR